MTKTLPSDCSTPVEVVSIAAPKPLDVSFYWFREGATELDDGARHNTPVGAAGVLELAARIAAGVAR